MPLLQNLVQAKLNSLQSFHGTWYLVHVITTRWSLLKETSVVQFIVILRVC